MRKSISVVLMSGFLLSGCTSYKEMRPIPLNAPDPLPARATTISDVQNNLETYSSAYLAFADGLRGKNYNLGDLAIAGGLLGVAGGIAESVGTAVAGAVMAAGPSMVSKRYQLAIQARNYESAAKAMRCMNAELQFAPNDNALVKYANTKIDNVHFLLREKQVSLELGDPDFDALETAITEARALGDQLDDLNTQNRALNADLRGYQAEQTRAGDDSSAPRAGLTSDINRVTRDINRIASRIFQVTLEKHKEELDKCEAGFQIN